MSGITKVNESEILRLINNQRVEHQKCAFHSRGSGLGDFAKLELLLRIVSHRELARYLEIVDDMRKGHFECYFCNMKILAFCEIISDERIHHRFTAYKAEYEMLIGEGDRFGRNYREEVREVIWGNVSSIED
jgi:hypothetical protein